MTGNGNIMLVIAMVSSGTDGNGGRLLTPKVRQQSKVMMCVFSLTLYQPREGVIKKVFLYGTP